MNGKFTNMAAPRVASASVSEFLHQFQRVDSYAEIDEVLRSRRCAQLPARTAWYGWTSCVAAQSHHRHLWHLDTWWKAHPEHRARSGDIEFLRCAANESLRLHQPVPALLRVATRDIVLESSGRLFRTGERIALFFSHANREPALFGEDVENFNPLRTTGRKPPPWGLSFGSGAHTCIGRALVTGLSQRYDDAHPTLGTIVGVLHALYQAGVALDPAQEPQRNTSSTHDAFASMPIVLHQL